MKLFVKRLFQLITTTTILATILPRFAQAATIECSAGDVQCLILAIGEANNNGEASNLIRLHAGTYTLTHTDNDTDGPNGLPSITSRLTIQGDGPETTAITQDADLGVERRLLHVGATGTLTVRGLTLNRGSAHFRGGSALYNHGGTVTIENSVFHANSRGTPLNNNGGMVTVTGTTFTENGLPLATGPSQSGAVDNQSGVVVIRECTFEDNTGEGGGGAITIRGGVVSIANSRFSDNAVFHGAGAIDVYGGMALISHTTFTKNSAELAGAIHVFSPGTLFVKNSTFQENVSARWGAAIESAGTAEITNSTFANNQVRFCDFTPATINNSGSLKLISSTLTGEWTCSGGGGPQNMSLIHTHADATTTLQNTILDRNSDSPLLRSCYGPTTSLGHNIIDDLSVWCTITLQPSDLLGEAGLGAFVDDGTPGNGRYPLLDTSQAIDAGNDGACPGADQLDTPRNGRCDIGAMEFYPVVNDLVTLGNLITAYDPAPVTGGPGGTFRIRAEFLNSSSQTIRHLFAEVIELSTGNLLLNADSGAGGTGARLTPAPADIPLDPGATRTFEFVIGLARPEPFTVFVNVLGQH